MRRTLGTLSEQGLEPFRWRNGVDTRIRAAAMLCLAALDDLNQMGAESAADEVRRRELEWLVRGLAHATRELAFRLIEMRKPLERGACAHCGWSRSSPRGELCPRCSRIVGVPREPPDRNSVSLDRDVPKPRRRR